MISLFFLFTASVDINLPADARCRERPIRYPALTMDKADAKLARDIAAEDIVVVVGDLATQVAQAHACVDPKRIYPFSGTTVADAVTLAHALPEETIDVAKAPFLGVTFGIVDVPASINPSEYGIYVQHAVPGLPGYQAGLRSGDTVLALNGESVTQVPKRSAVASFTRKIRASPAGTRAVLSVMRAATYSVSTRNDALVDSSYERLVADTKLGEEYAVAWTKVPEMIKISAALQPPLVHSQKLDRDPALEALVERIAEPSNADLFKRLFEGSLRPDPFRLPLVTALQRQPLSLRGATRALVAQPPLILAAGKLRTGLSPKQHLQQLDDLYAQAEALRVRAVRALSSDERRELPDRVRVLATKYLEHNYLSQDDNRDRFARNVDTINSLSKVDLSLMEQAAALLLNAATPEYVRALRADLLRAGLDVSQAVVIGSDHVVIGGSSDDDVSDFAGLRIDLGGNDFYRNAAAAITGVSLVVDAEGNDTYEAAVDLSLGAGLLGVGVLVDLAGDDHYLGLRMSQGVGVGGVGLLIDAAGQDEYRAAQLAQGTGFFGIGILRDDGGNDRYEGRSHVQGLAVGGGRALLVDKAGDDLYFAKGAQISLYETPGTYDCWCQGAGVGVRNLASGGLGMLYDGGGRDRVEGGDFSMGSGYYYGFGVAAMLGRDADTYIGNRYTLAAAAHNGIASFIDEGGDDVYDTRAGVAVSIANDYSMTWFSDAGGNDRYPAKAVSIGASLNNSLALFEDPAGRDEWRGNEAVGGSADNGYHGGTSLSLLALSSQLRSTERLPLYSTRGQHSFLFFQSRPLDSVKME